MYTLRALLSKLCVTMSLLMAIILVLASPKASDSLDASQVQILDAKHVIEPGIGNTVTVWVIGQVKHTLPMPITVTLQTRVYDSAGGVLGSHAFLIHDPIPPKGFRGFRHEALGYNLPSGTSVSKVTIEVMQVSQP